MLHIFIEINGVKKRQKKNIYALLFLSFISNTLYAQYIWYSGYSYRAPTLLNNSFSNLNEKKEPTKSWISLKNQIDISNYYWINRDYHNCIKTLNNAIINSRMFLNQNEHLAFTIKTKIKSADTVEWAMYKEQVEQRQSLSKALRPKADL
jgi:hypothetical protein